MFAVHDHHVCICTHCENNCNTNFQIFSFRSRKCQEHLAAQPKNCALRIEIARCAPRFSRCARAHRYIFANAASRAARTQKSLEKSRRRREID
jgi:hypothetical protein